MECGGCTLCCRLFDVKSVKAPHNVECEHCDIGVGCKIQKIKPDECREFDCAYVQSPNTPIELRPDNCKVIFEKITDKLFIGTLDARYDLTEAAMNQVRSFISQGYSVILGASDRRKPKIFIASGHNEIEILNDGRLRDRLNSNR